MKATKTSHKRATAADRDNSRAANAAEWPSAPPPSHARLPRSKSPRQSFADRIRRRPRDRASRVGKPLRWPLGGAPDDRRPDGRRGQPARQVLLRSRSSAAACCCTSACRDRSPFSSDSADARTARPLRPRHRARHACASPIRAASAPSSGRLRPTPIRPRSCSPACGLEPFDHSFDGALSARRAAPPPRRRQAGAARQATIVVGAGNIYACEALFEAGIDPRTRSDRISRRAPRGSPMRCGDRWHARSSSAARPCATSATRTALTGAVPARGQGLRPRRQARAFAADGAVAASSRGTGDAISARAARTAVKRTTPLPCKVCETSRAVVSKCCVTPSIRRPLRYR